MEYTLAAFATKLIDLFVNSKLMPNMNGVYTNKYGYTQLDSSKHKKRPEPRDLKTQIERSMNTTMEMDLTGSGVVSFNIGNEFMEINFPYYHILQQAPTIHKKNKGTNKSKGSQMFVKDKGARNYEIVSWGGKTFTKEYEKNVRGSRVNLSKATHKVDGEFKNIDSNIYLNTHYKYIDNIINQDVVDQLALTFGMKKVGAKSSASETTSLAEELAYDWDEPVETVLDIFGSLL